MTLLKRLMSPGIYMKLVLMFLLVLAPLYVIGLKMYESGAVSVKNEISNSLTSRVNLYSEILDTDFERTMRLMHEYVNDMDLLKLSTSSDHMTDIEKMDAVLRLKNRLDLLKGSSKFVENAIAYIPSMERSVSSNENAISDLNHEELNALIQLYNRSESPFIVWNNRMFISIPYPDVSISKNTQFVLAVEVAKPELASTLSRFTNAGGGAVISGKRTHWTVAGATDEKQSAEFLNQVNQVEHADRLEAGHVQTITIANETFMFAQKDSSLLNANLMMFVPIANVSKPLATYRIWFVVLSIAAIMLVFAFSYSIYKMIHKPLKSLIQAFRKLEQGDFNIRLQPSTKDEFGYLYERFNATVTQLGVLVHEVYEQKYRVQLVELRYLQSQINPHFLYNTYFILYRMATLEDNENIIRLTKHLGEYFQYITRDGADDVSFDKEAHHAKTYTDIQTVRFGKRITVDFGELPEGATDILVPRLILQPIIENAYKYALEQRAKEGWLRVQVFILDNELVVEVEDNGEEMTPERLITMQIMLRDLVNDKESTGLINVHRRLQIKYGVQAGIRLEIGERNGLKVKIVIPV
jgi:two-component system sensor histidine kinase YesM